MPQLDTSTWPSQLIWLAITFGLLYFVVSRLIIPRTGAVIEKRKATIDGDLASAQQHKLDAESALKAYEASMAKARADAGAHAAQTRNALNVEADATIGRVNAEMSAKISAAEQSISAAKAKAMESIETIAADLSSSIVAELIGGQPVLATAGASTPTKRKK
jgi:F-type H+-transporting ATPase subunit b